MKKKLTKVVVLASVLTMMAMNLVACASKCDLCGETGKCETLEIFGEKVKICEDCSSLGF